MSGILYLRLLLYFPLPLFDRLLRFPKSDGSFDLMLSGRRSRNPNTTKVALTPDAPIVMYRRGGVIILVNVLTTLSIMVRGTTANSIRSLWDGTYLRLTSFSCAITFHSPSSEGLMVYEKPPEASVRMVSV